MDIYDPISHALGLTPMKFDFDLSTIDYTHTHVGIAPFKGQKHSDETKAQIKNSKTGTKHKPETIEKMKAARQNVSTETRAKMSAVRKGKKIHTDDSKARISATQKGRPLTEAHKAALRIPKRKFKQPTEKSYDASQT